MPTRDIFFYYNLFILACLGVFFGILLLNLIDLKRLSKKSPARTPFISVLIPARNEERSIEACVRSVLMQQYPNFEVIVLNDHSTDRTGEILAKLQTEFASLRVISGTALPEGWLGKCWACHQLSNVATGEVLLFTDADTVHESFSLMHSAASREESGADMLTAVPYQQLGSFWEKIIVPLVHFSIMCFLPLRMVWQSRNTAFAFANGQFILFTRTMYEKIGGHESVRQNLVEDVWLVKKVKQAGGKVMVYSGIDDVRCRMYHSGREAWQGFSKNLFAGLNYNTAAMASVCLVNFICFIFPYIGLGFDIGLDIRFSSESLLTRTPERVSSMMIIVLQIVLALVMRVMIALKFRLPVLESFLHIMSIAAFIGIAANSVRWIKSGQGALWKGRRYNFSNS
jgi:chlorobactene glucosyltransferase